MNILKMFEVLELSIDDFKNISLTPGSHNYKFKLLRDLITYQRKTLAKKYHDDGSHPDPNKMSKINCTVDEILSSGLRLFNSGIYSDQYVIQNRKIDTPTWRGFY